MFLALLFVAGTDRVLPVGEARVVLDRYYKLLHDAKSIHIVEDIRHGAQSVHSEEWLMRPNYWRSVSRGNDASGKIEESRTYATDTVVYRVNLAKKSYLIMDRAPGSPFLNGFEPYCQNERPEYTKRGKVTETEYSGRAAYAIETGEQSLPGSMVSVIVDRKTLTPIAWNYHWKGRDEFHDYTSVKFNETMNKADFAWKPPKEFKLEGDLRRPTKWGGG